MFIVQAADDMILKQFNSRKLSAFLIPHHTQQCASFLTKNTKNWYASNNYPASRTKGSSWQAALAPEGLILMVKFLSHTYGSIPIRTNDTIGGVISQKFGLMSFRTKSFSD